MQKLTENIIHQKIRPCPTDLGKILQLNITGRGLSDVGLIKKMTGLEVISLSVNKISSLSYFEDCKNLRELYLRQNKIADLAEIKYLMNLSKLEVLNLSQNPCAEEPFYRFTVIKFLKNLSELDGATVTDEDRKEAEVLGRDLSTPVVSSHDIFSRESPRLMQSRSRLNQTVKITSSIPTTEMNGNLDALRKNGNLENTTNGTEFSSKLRRIQSKSQRLFDDDITTALLVVESVSRLTHSQCRNIQNSKIDLSSPSSQFLDIIEETSKPSNSLMAALYVIKDLSFADLQILHMEVTTLLHAMASNYEADQKHGGESKNIPRFKKSSTVI